MNKKQRLVFGVSIVALLLGYLALSSVESNNYEVSQAVAAKDNLSDKVILVNGSMVPGSEKWDAINRTFAFKLTDGKATIDVAYKGNKPDLPAEATNIQAVVTGKFNDNVFEAFNLVTKCPSKYEANGVVVK